jgi:phosphoglycerate dehydrogenase-like enzyme
VRARVWIEADEWRGGTLEHAVRVGGGSVASAAEDANAIVWAVDDPDLIVPLLHDGIDWVQLSSAGIEEWFLAGVIDSARVWTAAKGVYAGPIAEYCLGMMLAVARQLPDAIRTPRWQPLVPRSLSGSTVTVVGAGGIGKALLRLLEPFGADTRGVTRSGRAVPGADRAFPAVDLDTALPGSDWVVFAAPATPETEHLLSRERLQLLDTRTWVLNVGRGTVIDTDALVDAIIDGRLGGAILDVTDPEPLPDAHPLWGAPNVLVTSHTANTPTLGAQALAERVSQNVARFIHGEELLGVVDYETGY